MDKPENPFRAGSCSYMIFEGDWESKTLDEIALAVGSTPASVYGLIRSINAKTKYQILYTKLPGDSAHRGFFRKEKTSWRNINLLHTNNKNCAQNCDTCYNLDCNIRLHRKAITWKNCSGYMPEPEGGEET